MNPPYEYVSPLAKCVIRVENSWYDVTAFRHSHPGGAEIIDKFHNEDATDAFNSIHSKEALAKLHRMKAKPAETPRAEVSVAFETWRQELIKNGWYDRDWKMDFARVIGPIISMFFIGTFLATSHPVLASIILGVCMQQAGWGAHDYIHGRGVAAYYLGYCLAWINGFSRGWWSHKHNFHHTFPNRVEYDADIHNEPILHLWFPKPEKDVWFRKYQHFYYPLAYSFLYVSWRTQSITFALRSSNWTERALIAANYIWLASLPWKVAIASVFIGGFLVAIVVTANHQPEEMLHDGKNIYNYFVDQIITTRGVSCPDPVTEYLFGGMQYQLEHHLFPFMPKYRYRLARPLLKKFCEQHNLDFKVSGIKEIMYLNFVTMKKMAQELPPAKAKTN